MKSLSDKNWRSYFPIFCFAAAIVMVIVSRVYARRPDIWFLEIIPLIFGVVFCAVTYRIFRMSNFMYFLLLSGAIIISVGATYTYHHSPVGDWVKALTGSSRNNYDRFGHVFQGIVPVFLFREFLLRFSPIKQGKWLFFICVCVALFFSAWYEIIESWVAIIKGKSADAFLGLQGDMWDAQWDMFCAFCGAFFGQIFFSRLHDISIENVTNRVSS